MDINSHNYYKYVSGGGTLEKQTNKKKKNKKKKKTSLHFAFKHLANQNISYESMCKFRQYSSPKIVISFSRVFKDNEVLDLSYCPHARVYHLQAERDRERERERERQRETDRQT